MNRIVNLTTNHRVLGVNPKTGFMEPKSTCPSKLGISDGELLTCLDCGKVLPTEAMQQVEIQTVVTIINDTNDDGKKMSRKAHYYQAIKNKQAERAARLERRRQSEEPSW